MWKSIYCENYPKGNHEDSNEKPGRLKCKNDILWLKILLNNIGMIISDQITSLQN